MTKLGSGDQAFVGNATHDRTQTVIKKYAGKTSHDRAVKQSFVRNPTRDKAVWIKLLLELLHMTGLTTVIQIFC